MKIHFSIAKNKKAKDVSAKLLNLYGQVELEKADIIVAVGGDGAMLAAMRESIYLLWPKLVLMMWLILIQIKDLILIL